MSKLNLRGYFVADSFIHGVDPGELRGSPRRRLALETWARGAAPGQDPVFIHNVSESGMLLETGRVFAIGDVMEVDLPGIEGIRAGVVWKSAEFYGCRFNRPIAVAALRSIHDIAERFAAEGRDDALDPPTSAAPVPRQPLDFAEQLFRLRKARGLTLEKLAVQLGVSKPTVWAWEKGRARPSPRFMSQLAEVLQVPAAELTNRDPTPDVSRLIARCRDQIASALATDASRVRIYFEM